MYETIIFEENVTMIQQKDTNRYPNFYNAILPRHVEDTAFRDYAGDFW